MKQKRVLAVASIGGHWIQLLRICQPLETKYDIIYMSTHSKCRTMINNNPFFFLPDFNRSNVWKMIYAIFKVLYVLLKTRPHVVITTGAAPGLLTIIFARILKIKTIWIDSIANVKQMSACGQLACKLAQHVYTQWPDLTNSKVKYKGNVFGE